MIAAMALFEVRLVQSEILLTQGALDLALELRRLDEMDLLILEVKRWN